MDQNFSLMAQSRANYYTAGSPVQFVRVELLKGDVTGEVAVCLSFKNVGTEPLTGMVIHFKCKDASGQILCEDDFYYEQLNANPGELFGTDDAVYVSDTPVSSVEIEQDRAFLNGRGVDLRGYKRVRLPVPRMLPGSIAKLLQARTNNTNLICVPQDIEQGWFCACGAFHPNEENTSVCSECGGDKAYIKVTLTRILEEARKAAEQQQREINAIANPTPPQQPGTPVQPANAVQQPAAARQPVPMGSSPTGEFAANAVQSAILQARSASAQPEMNGGVEPESRTAYNVPQRHAATPSYPPVEKEQEEDEGVRRYMPKGRLFDDEPEESNSHTQMYDTNSYEDLDDDESKGKRRGRYADDEDESEDDALAERIIRWAPPITAIVCALIIAVSLIYRFVIA